MGHTGVRACPSSGDGTVDNQVWSQLTVMKLNLFRSKIPQRELKVLPISNRSAVVTSTSEAVKGNVVA